MKRERCPLGATPTWLCNVGDHGVIVHNTGSVDALVDDAEDFMGTPLTVPAGGCLTIPGSSGTRLYARAAADGAEVTVVTL